jgi:hypothetical protein
MAIFMPLNDNKPLIILMHCQQSPPRRPQTTPRQSSTPNQSRQGKAEIGLPKTRAQIERWQLEYDSTQLYRAQPHAVIISGSDIH